MRKTPLALGLVAVLLCSGVARAQSLGEVAKKEEERRKAVKSAGKVYTNDDLHRYPAGPVPATPGQAEAAGTVEGQPVDPVEAAKKAQEAAAAPQKAEEQEKKDETWWRQRMMGARELLRRSETYLEAMQTRVNSLTNDFYARDDPAQRATIWSQRTAALQEMERLRKDIVDQKKEIADIEEEARKEGVPPGWLR